MTEGIAQTVRVLAGRYQVGELIGHGGMADVHVGTDARLGRRVAIKLLRPALAADPAFRSRFRREAQDAAKMAHPTIVRIFDAGEETALNDEGVEVQVPFIIMEFVDGRLLKDIIGEGPIESAEAARITAQVLTALEYSHRAGVVHRDIKPGNIMITTSGQVKVMDFGIARAISESSATIAETSTIVGTAQYFSPEQARGEAVDARSDLYSMGIVLFEMLTGQAPFVGKNPVAVAYLHVNQQAVRPSALVAAVTPALDAVVFRALAKDRFERFQTAAEFRTEVEAAASGSVVARKQSTNTQFNSTLFGVNPTTTTNSEATLRHLTAHETDRSIRTQNRPPVAWIWAGIAILVVVVLGVGVWAYQVANTTVTLATSPTMPDVRGMTWDSAAAELQKAGFTVERADEPDNEIASGQVSRTDPAAGLRVSEGGEVVVYVSTGGVPTSVPKMVGLTQAEVEKALADAGLKVGEVSVIPSARQPEGVVVKASVKEGEEISSEVPIDLFVSSGLVEIPSVIEKPIDEATIALTGFRYRLKVVQEADASCGGGLVTKQSIEGEQEQGSTVTLTYCSG